MKYTQRVKNLLLVIIVAAASLLTGCTMPKLVNAEIPTLIPTWTVVSLNFAPATETPAPPTQEAAPPPAATEEPPPAVPAASAQCPASPPQRVDIGKRARVTITNGTPLRVRKEPVVDPNNILLQLDEGTPFDIIGGPSCWADGGNNFTFWQIIMADGKTGWVAEGTAGGYFIEPMP